MYAIIETGGKQYRVENGDQIRVEKLNVEDGKAVVFDKVLAAGEGSDIKIGTPYLDGLTVEGKSIESAKGDKVIIFKYKSKKDYRKKQGHRQPYTLVEITAIAGEKAAPKKEEAKAEPAKKAAPKKDEAKAEPDKKAAPKKEETAEESPAEEKSLEKMLKSELVEYAKANGIEVDEKALKADILAAIKAAK